jgi:hypothetical protein
MSKGAFTDRHHPPTLQEIRAALGLRRTALDELDRYMAENYQVQGELFFGGLDYGWGVRFRKNGKPLLALFPGQKRLIANVVVGRSLLKQAEALKLGANARQVLESAKRFYEGCWLNIQIRSRRDLLDIRQLIALKARPRPAPPPAASAPRAA